MNISIIGAGNIAYFIARRLKTAGYNVLEIYARKLEDAQKLANLVNAKALDDMHRLSSETDAFLFAIPDKEIASFSSMFPVKNILRIHCSGSSPIDILESQNAGVIWPLYSIKKDLLPKEKNMPVFWESSGKNSQKIILKIAFALSENIHFADYKQRQELHLSAVFVNNFVNHLMAITIERMQAAGLSFNDALQPIIQQTLYNAFKGISSERQTGPAIRHDQITMQKQIQSLENQPDWQAVYKAISNSIQNFYTSSKP